MQKKNSFKSRVNPGRDRQMPVRESLSPCNKCRKSHGSKPCLFNQNICYQCGKSGHYAKDCNTRKPLNNPIPRPQTKGSIHSKWRRGNWVSWHNQRDMFYQKHSLNCIVWFRSYTLLYIYWLCEEVKFTFVFLTFWFVSLYSYRGKSFYFSSLFKLSYFNWRKIFCYWSCLFTFDYLWLVLIS